MNTLRILLALQLILAGSGFAQVFNFPLTKANDKYDVRIDSGRISCLYRISLNDVEPTVFRKVFLDENLQQGGLVDYTIPGIAHLIASEANEKYTIHVFYSKNQLNESIHFIATEKSGKIYSAFTKSATDFAPLFTQSIKKVSKINLTFVENTGSPDMLILRPRLTKGSTSYPGKTVACSMEDGHWLWTLERPYPYLSRIITTDNKLIGLSSEDAGGSVYMPHYTLHFFDKQKGSLIRSTAFYPVEGYRVVSVFTSNGQELMIAGSEYLQNKVKDGHFFMSMFDLSGQRIFDQVDTTARLSSQRMHTLGHVFDQEGNLFIIGEGWKFDYTGAIASTAVSIIFLATLGVSPGVHAQADHKITSLVMAKISPKDGTVKDFYTFPVGPWMQFSNLITDEEHVLITNSSRVLLYNPDQPNMAPANFTSLQNREGLIIAPFGPVVVKVSRKNIGLEILHTDH